jgi:hypothetical protein
MRNNGEENLIQPASSGFFLNIWWPIPLFFDLFLFHESIGPIQYFAWGLRCGCILKTTGSLLAGELSCCDCFGLKSVEELVPFP